MKALPTATILRMMYSEGIYIDASSTNEVLRAQAAGIPLKHISLTTQEWDEGIRPLVKDSLVFDVASLHQLEELIKDPYFNTFKKVGVRVNVGMGGGFHNKTNVGGPDASFGIWHEQIPTIKALAEKHQVDIKRVHTHVGSGNNPDSWREVLRASLQAVRQLPSVTTLNIGGGFKVARVPEEEDVDFEAIGKVLREELEAFFLETGRAVVLEIEPGTALVANAGCLVSTVQDIVSTKSEDPQKEGGHRFLKLDTGMTEIIRPSLYGSQHTIRVVPASASSSGQGAAKEEEVVVVGHCCESGDLITASSKNPSLLAPRRLPKASIGDLAVIEGTGAYCASMSTVNYNSFVQAPEVVLRENGEFELIRRRQTLEQMYENESFHMRQRERVEAEEGQ